MDGAEEQAALADAKREAGATIEPALGMVIMGFDRPDPGGTAIYGLDGARMERDPKTSVLIQWSQSHNMPNLVVTHSAQMSSLAGKNPSIVYMTLTARTCDYTLKKLCEGLI